MGRDICIWKTLCHFINFNYFLMPCKREMKSKQLLKLHCKVLQALILNVSQLQKLFCKLFFMILSLLLVKLYFFNFHGMFLHLNVNIDFISRFYFSCKEQLYV